MGVIDDFLGEYERQFDFWEASALTVRGLLETEFASSGLRAIVTSRAKSVDRLADKIRVRDRKSPYASVGAIRHDIVDLAGVRVALYFPGQMSEVVRVIRTTLDVQSEKRFPPEQGPVDFITGGLVADFTDGRGRKSDRADFRQPRFSGYGAQHFRVRIPESSLSAGHERYATAVVEVQVASVLMHAWSEVQHDLVYKPLEGALSTSEYALLDQLNGLVLAGEIALEQLQKAGDERVAAAETPFRSHYELAEFLRTRLSALGANLTEATLGQVDVLFDYLADQSSATGSAVEPYLDLLERDFERRPVAAQLADLMLSGNESRYRSYLQAMASSRHPLNRRRTTIANLKAESPEKLAVGEFVIAWVLFETLLNDLLQSDGVRLPPLPVLVRQLAKQGLITEEQEAELNLMRELRNRAFHGRAGDVPPEDLTRAADRLRHLTADIERSASQELEIRPATASEDRHH